MSQATVFELLGGEAGIRALVDKFYDLMALETEFAQLHALHPPDHQASRDKLFWFLCGWSGGPDYFVERFGHPRLKMRHMPYKIGMVERDQWLQCIAQAMNECGVKEPLFSRLLESFYNTADWMRNQ